eukprot:CAMPEP_0197702772 /NCGR_PEP_ID=MMETSP1338-20131121/124933_1 /TAXON_ID=43686 ORGANISM="Pelagodinium beii, Strain RCC1491" /NCGR_SAMPLE_ID=MMETSP1338 /ASSEMBLY_ACC=CAM_ASM_000754 /LENGTH=42 /DNA_ID= /DNA_START= /DNA_END= /DNA_ORIENTATION=
MAVTWRAFQLLANFPVDEDFLDHGLRVNLKVVHSFSKTLRLK